MEIQNKEGVDAIKFKNSCVAIISYTLDENGVLNKIGVIKEKNPHFEIGYTQNLIMGTVDKEDTSLLQRAIIELQQEGGIEITDSSKWIYLGEMYTSKLSIDPIFIFAVNISDVIPSAVSKETILSFDLLDTKDAIKIQDSILLSSFFKLFLTIYYKEFKNI